ncbi:hypothetical protein [Priestia filamentosa]|uniref:Uncharacterized protein n=1 Tax=Priestia filamentosa TaxID=1402861 RepID=A0A1X7G2K8_9BACI|nr:hypothetical protein [Priestia filamentosa]AKO92107.1 hypothetical protein BEH_08345 [Priestia filamentosa]MDT3762115.1 hypothetical protein [Priestia filamentosa]OXS65904.1 hypothetical protein B1B01_20870 [Priestia filamentosa]RJS64607.1 hypothetical protein CJ485_07560 [Priestia filamentosa]WCM17199.1 hypothetical protein PGN40_07560 [Priestia filamentosa]
MKGKSALLAVLLLPWLSLFKVDKLTFKRYLPVLTFSSLVIALISELSKSYTWWKVKTPIFPRLSSDISFIFGPFFIANFWVFKLTYGKFKRYMLLNILFDYMFAYPLTSIAEKLKIYKMVNMTRFQLFILSIATAVINYAYQFFIQDVLKSDREMKKQN